MEKSLQELEREREILLKRLQNLLSAENPKVLRLQERIYNLDLQIEKVKKQEKNNFSFADIFSGRIIGA